MEKKLREIRERVLGDLRDAQGTGNLEQVRVGVLGKKGELTALLRGMGQLPAEERPRMGQLVNDVRKAIEDALEARSAELKAKEKEARLEKEAVDVTLPGPERSAGSLHPMNIALNRMVDIFVGMGYEVVEGPEVEYDHYNFELLNVPKNHPARDAQDTFYVEDNIVLRSQTSPVQARVMTTRKAAAKVISERSSAGTPAFGASHRLAPHHSQRSPDGRRGVARPGPRKRGRGHSARRRHFEIALAPGVR